jgi:uncharacterized Tic20 family protein
MDTGPVDDPTGHDAPPPPPGPPAYGAPGAPGAPGGPGAPPPGYAAPGAQPPGYGAAYPPPGYGYGPPTGYNYTGIANSDERMWAMFSHLSFFVFGLIGPIIIMATKGNESSYVREQAVEALNFHITILLASLASAILILVLIGIFTLIATIVVAIVFTIMAALAANRGERYRYPINLRLVK